MSAGERVRRCSISKNASRKSAQCVTPCSVSLARCVCGGFTLVELLIVIAIILLLAAILFPVFGRARENARRTTCISNMRQLAMGMHMYAQDNDERMPFDRLDPPNPNRFISIATGERVSSCASTATTCVHWFWPDLIFPYVKNAQAFNDPSPANRFFSGCTFLASTNPPLSGGTKGTSCVNVFSARTRAWTYQGPRASTLDPSTTPATVRSARNGIAYAMSQQFGAGTAPYYGHLAAVRYPSEKLLLAEAVNYNAQLPGSAGYCGMLVPRHFNGVTVGFVDGHSKWVRWDFVCADQNSSEESKHLWFINGVDS